MKKEEFLINQHDFWLKIESDNINHIISNFDNISNWSLAMLSAQLWDCSKMLALYEYFIQNDYRKSKILFYRCGRLMEFSSKRCDVFPTYNGLQQLAYNMLSDNSKLIQSFANLSYTQYLGESYMQAVSRGDATPLYIVQCLIKDDFNEYERVMPIMKTKTLKKTVLWKLDIMFYEGLAERNKTKMEEALALLLQPKMHKKRNTMPMESELLSHPALGYAKLAWYKGIEVEVDSPLIPKEWLPIQPLKDEEYIDYDFAKAYLG